MSKISIQSTIGDIKISLEADSPEKANEDFRELMELFGATAAIPSGDAPENWSPGGGEVATPEKKAPVAKKEAPAEPEEGPKVFTKAELQGVVKDALAAGERQAVIETFQKYGAAKIGDLEEKDFTAAAKDILKIIGG